MNTNFIESYEQAMKFCRIYYPNALSNNNQHDGYFGLDEEDIERIQEVLDDSDDDFYDDDDEDVVFLSDDENEFPMPKKITNNN